MIANAIAFFLTAIFVTIAIYGFYQVGQQKVPEDQEGKYLLISFWMLLLAWMCAKLGGI